MSSNPLVPQGATSKSTQSGIQRSRTPEPLSPQARRLSQHHGGDWYEEKWAQSDAYQQLKREIQRYARGESNGTSVLLAGHRGSGKTTIAHLAIQQVEWEAELKKPWEEKTNKDPRDETFFHAIPFLVPIHGPDLFFPDSSIGAKGGTNEADETALAENAMKHIRRALHRALAEEMGRRYAEYAAAIHGEDRALIEAAHELRVQLDGAPSLAMLRTYWHRLGLLDRGPDEPSGVLRHFRDQKAKDFPDVPSTHRGMQGFREVMALFTATKALDARRRTPDEQAAREEQNAKDQMANIKSPTEDLNKLPFADPKRLSRVVAVVAPILSLVTAAYFHKSIGSVMGDYSPVVAVLIGLVTYVFLSRGLTEPERRENLTDDAAPAAQDLMLPVLVERIEDAGLAPIFVVDELDKVDDLPLVFGKMMKRLKYIATDRTFFCFLADREYYEHFQDAAEARYNSMERTFFSTRLLIYHHPDELHVFLRESLNLELIPPTLPGDLVSDLFGYLVLSQSYNHIGNLTRAVAAYTLNGVLALGPNWELWKVPGYRLQILMQAGIEAVFLDSKVQGRLREEPWFTQWLSDALYLIVREWREERRIHWGPYAADESPDLRTLQEKLVERASSTSGQNSLADYLPHALDNHNLRLLQQLNRELISYLLDPCLIALSYLRAEIWQDRWAGVVMIALQSAPLLGPSEERYEYTWQFNQFGETKLKRGAREGAPLTAAELEIRRQTEKERVRKQEAWRMAVQKDKSTDLWTGLWPLHALEEYLRSARSSLGELMTAMIALAEREGKDCLLLKITFEERQEIGLLPQLSVQSQGSFPEFSRRLQADGGLKARVELRQFVTVHCTLREVWQDAFRCLARHANGIARGEARTLVECADADWENDSDLLEKLGRELKWWDEHSGELTVAAVQELYKLKNATTT